MLKLLASLVSSSEARCWYVHLYVRRLRVRISVCVCVCVCVRALSLERTRVCARRCVCVCMCVCVCRCTLTHASESLFAFRSAQLLVFTSISIVSSTSGSQHTTLVSAVCSSVLTRFIVVTGYLSTCLPLVLLLSATFVLMTLSELGMMVMVKL